MPIWRNPGRKNRDATVSLAIMPFFLNSLVWPQGWMGKKLDGEMLIFCVRGVCSSCCRPHGAEALCICSQDFENCVELAGCL